MNKCLVTKLNGSSNNSELLRLGEMRMQILKVSNPTDHTQGFSIGVNKATTLEIVSGGYFTDQTLTENKGSRITINVGINSIWVNGNSDVEIAILDKYSLVSINSYYVGDPSSVGKNNVKLDISDLKYSNALTSINCSDTQASGDIANLKNLNALTSITFSNTQVSGDIANLNNLTALNYIVLPNTQVRGDIANLKNLTALNTISIYNQLEPLTGNIGQLSALSNCVEMQFKQSRLTGDLALLPSKCRFASFKNDKGSVFTWSTRPSTAKIIAIEGNAKLTDIDKMLIDQAQCQVGFSSNDGLWLKLIEIAGNRTSASDAAVATLQQKGYTVSIIPA